MEGNKNIDYTKHFLGTKDANPLIFKTNKIERMRITSGGYIGIGTTNIPSGFTMAVCGKIKSQEILVEPPGWCDYVFEPEYKLTPWDSLMQYIKEHKHLPGVPSEKEVEAAGIPVGEINKVLLQKIEELVLYNNELRK